MKENTNFWFRLCIDALLYSNVWIGLAAALQTYRSIVICGTHPDGGILPKAIGWGTLAFYSLLRLIKIYQNQGPQTPRFGSSRVYQRVLIAGMLCAAYPLFFQFAALSDHVKALFFLFSFLTLAYGWSFGLGSIRQLPYLKSFFVPALWVCVTVVIPMWNCDNMYLHALERFLFIFAITLPFDLRDAETDAKHGIRTMANVFGIDMTTIIALIALVLSLILSPFSLGGVLVCAIAALVILYLRGQPRHDYWYTGVLDGLLILDGFIALYQ